MKEQATTFSSIGISAEFVGEGHTDPTAKSRVLSGNVQLMFISPENLFFDYRSSSRAHIMVLPKITFVLHSFLL